MRGIYFAFLVSALISTSAAAEASGWDLVFFDEFSGATLDRDKWATRYIYKNETLDHFKDEVQRYRDNENHQLKDGVLALVARQSSSSALFDSGMIRSHQTLYYGYFEARILLPSAIGVWPAFWLHGDYSADGKVWYPPEIDIFEFVNNGVEDLPNMLHSGPGGEASDKWPVFLHKSQNFEPRYNTMIDKTPVSGS